MASKDYARFVAGERIDAGDVVYVKDGRIWKALAIVLPAMLIAALALRQHGPTEKPAVQIAAPADTAEK